MNNDRLRQFLVIMTTAALISLNVLANVLPLNGLNTGEISDRFDIFFVPAGYVFSIWFLIYVGLIAYTVYQALPSQRKKAGLRAIASWYIFGSAANVIWLFLWHYEQFSFTLFAMVGLLVSLIMIYLRLDIGHSQVPAAEKWTVHLTFSVYLGWITVATIANATQLLFYLGWNGLGIAPEVWAVILLGAGVIISAIMSLTRRDAAYSLVLVWAYIGIALKFPQTATVAYTAWISAAVILLLLALAYLRNLNRPHRPQTA